MKFLEALFSENSSVSMMRVLSLVSLGIGGYLAISGHDISVSVFVVSAFGGKFLQKAIESKT